MDIRLYCYYSGQLKKVGRGVMKSNPHKFRSIEDCENRINELIIKNHIEQYIIIEYTDKYKSKIIKLIDSNEIRNIKRQ